MASVLITAEGSVTLEDTFDPVHCSAYSRAKWEGQWYVIGHWCEEDYGHRRMVWLEEAHGNISGYVDLPKIELWERPT